MPRNSAKKKTPARSARRKNSASTKGQTKTGFAPGSAFRLQSLVDQIKRATDSLQLSTIAISNNELPAPIGKFTKLDAEGNTLPADAKPEEVAAIRLNRTGRIMAACYVAGGKAMQHQEACDAAAAFTWMGHKDWQLATREDLLEIIDLNRYEPACDTGYFHWIKPAWCWAKETYKPNPSSYAWGVSLGSGSSYLYVRGGRGLVLAVRSARARQ